MRTAKRPLDPPEILTPGRPRPGSSWLVLRTRRTGARWVVVYAVQVRRGLSCQGRQERSTVSLARRT